MDWIVEIKKDPEKTLKKIYLNYEDECLLWLRKKYSVNLEDAKEVFQVSLIIFYENVMGSKLTELNASLKTYLFSIAKNKARELLRSHQQEIRTDDPFPLIKQLVTNEEEDNYQERLKIAIEGLKQLGNPCSALLNAFYIKNHSMIEIAKNMSYKNADTVKNLKYKCMKRLRSIISSIK